MLYPIARKLLFCLEAEAAHDFALDQFARFPTLSTLPFQQRLPKTAKTVAGLRFDNIVGLAAGLDKNGRCLEAWSRLGFGFVEIGTTTPRPQAGNPKPRMFRLEQHQALINRLGFNNLGVDVLVDNVKSARQRGVAPKVLGINIGKNASTPLDRAVDDYRECLQKVHAHADYITVNISSPNTQGLRDLQGEGYLRDLLRQLRHALDTCAQAEGRMAPIFVKLAPDLNDEALKVSADIAQSEGMSGLILSNTTLEREAVRGHVHAQESGGLSGEPLTALAQNRLLALRGMVGAGFPLIGVGGIHDTDSARQRLAAGADLLQIYTGFIYQGPKLIKAVASASLGGLNAT
jgi:dihydroorotate dehydrogenase